LLKEQGYECVGVFMRVGAATNHRRDAGATLRHGCCSVADALDARAVAGRLGIPFYALNFQPDFERIIDYFVDEYARARTPNPCVICNTQLKFGKLLRYADMLDAEFVATGHYARILRDHARVRLARAVNQAKDQSYVLFGIRREDVGRCLFPLGEIADKATVRRLAVDLGLHVYDKADSQEICFVPDDDYKPLVRARRPATQRPGEVRDATGQVLGTHAGVANYTIGQRRGLGIATGQPIYVTRLDVASNTVMVGPREELLSCGLIAENVNWLADTPADGAPRPATIKIRHMHTPAAGTITPLSSGAVEVQFDQPQPAVTPGQAAVFYDDEVVLGGGWIERAL
jgi:tRNA-specific 2-thiouridylase